MRSSKPTRAAKWGEQFSPVLLAHVGVLPAEHVSIVNRAVPENDVPIWSREDVAWSLNTTWIISSWLGGIFITQSGNYQTIWMFDIALCAIAAAASYSIRRAITKK